MVLSAPDGFRDYPMSKIMISLRQKLFIRNVLLISLVILTVCWIYRSILPRDLLLPSKSESFISHPPSYPLAANPPPEVWSSRAAQVKQAFVHAYHGYERYAAPNDELLPLSNGMANPFNGWGVTMYDSLDTMLLMELDDEFRRALPFIQRADFSLPERKFAPFFETVIRYLGGLLSAYTLSNETVLLEKAETLAQVLDPIFNTTSGFPLYSVNTVNGNVIGPSLGILAEIASLQLEYTYLAKLSGKKQYFDRGNRIIELLATADLRNTGGMFPTTWSVTSGQPQGSRLSVGAQADSAHEYLLKQYLMTGRTDKASLKMYIRTTNHILTNLLYLSPSRHLLYVTDTSTIVNKTFPSHTFEHLSCFLPGLLALGAHILPLDDLSTLGINFKDLIGKEQVGNATEGYDILSSFNLKDMHLWAAEGLAQTCWLTYADQPTGLGPDEVTMSSSDSKSPASIAALWIEAMGHWKGSGAREAPPGAVEKPPVVYTNAEIISGTGTGRDYTLRKSGYLLRPETIESLYILWRVTGDYRWRQRAWIIFEAIERETRTSSGYASVLSVERSPAIKKDDMPSYFLAETLKYLYLLFIDEDPLPLSTWVFNTEAHPFPVFQWSEQDRGHFGI